MPRPWRIRVKLFPSLNPSRWYPMRVLRVKPAGPTAISVTLEHLAPDQAGRTHVISLPLPLHPEGLTTQFFASTGQNVAADEEIDPAATVSRTVSVHLEVEGDVVRAVAFRPPGHADAPGATKRSRFTPRAKDPQWSD